MTAAIDELTGIIEREYYSFDALQLVAVIEELLGDTGGGGGRVFFEVDADLSFPPADVGYVCIDAECINNNGRINNDTPAATVRMPVMNLLGSSSPLPIAFSDHITRGRRDADMYADFLSILQNRLHALWIDACRRHPPEKIFEFLTGLPINKDRGSAATGLPYGEINTLLSYARNDSHCEERSDEAIQKAATPQNAHFVTAPREWRWPLANRTRSAQGLKEALYAALGEDVPINIEENVGRYAAVSNARPLGGAGAARLGRNAFAGARVYDRTAKFRVAVGPLDGQTYEAFMPGGSGYRLVKEVLAVYLNEPVICEILITCKPDDLPGARLGGGGRGGGLGRTAVLGTGRRRPDGAAGRSETLRIGEGSP